MHDTSWLRLVLFHRTKLALTGLLDRCLLEIADLYRQVGFGGEEFKTNAEALLLNASDDGLPLIMKELVVGSDTEIGKRLQQAIAQEGTAIQEATSGQQASLIETALPGEAAVRGRLGARMDLVLRLIDKLRDREVYTLAYKLRMADFPGDHNPDNPRLCSLLGIYREPQNRLDYLRKMEVLCGFEAGTLVMNCPPDAAMNAKVAQVNLLIEDEMILPFDKYEEKHRHVGLTRRALLAQIDRFYELWAASVYVDRRKWDRLSQDERKHLRSVIEEFFFQMDHQKDSLISRAQIQPSLDLLRKKASQKATTDPAEEAYKTSQFPNGMPFANPDGR